MKKTLLITTLVAALSTSLFAAGKHKAGIVKLPHPMKVLLQNSEQLNISDAQMEKINTIAERVPPKIHPLMDEAATLEKTIRLGVVKEKMTRKDVEAKVEKLQTIKREITTLQIDAINEMQSILDDTQYKLLLKLMHDKYKAHKKHKHTHKQHNAS